MGTLLRFPDISSTRRDRRSRDLSQIMPDFVQQLESFRKLAESSLTAGLATTVDRLETALADVDAIGRLLPPGEFKTQFDLDRSALTKQLDLAKGKIVGLQEQMDHDGQAPVRG